MFPRNNLNTYIECPTILLLISPQICKLFYDWLIFVLAYKKKSFDLF